MTAGFACRSAIAWLVCVLLAALPGPTGAAAAADEAMRLRIDVASVGFATPSDALGAAPSAWQALSPDARPERADRSDRRWIRLHVAQDWRSPGAPLLLLGEVGHGPIALWLPSRDITVQAARAHPGARPAWSARALVFELPRDLRHDEAIYIDLALMRTIPPRIELVDATHHQPRDLAHAQAIAALYAAIAFSVLVVLCFWLVLRERVYLHYVAYIGTFLLFLLYDGDLAFRLPVLRELAPLEARAAWFFGVASAAFVLAFARRFADLPRYAPRFARFFDAARWLLLALAAALLLPATAIHDTVSTAANLLMLLLNPVLLVACSVAAARGSRYALLFLLGWFPLIVVTLWRVLIALGLLPDATPGDYGLQLAAVWEAAILSLALAYRALSIRRERDVARQQAEFDGLTGVLNRRALQARLRAAYIEAEQKHTQLGVLFLDLDHFKRINDGHGHAAGDECLRAVVARILPELRPDDVLGRFGGEEFLVALPGADETRSVTVAERIRRSIQGAPVEVDGVSIPVTLSIGVAAMTDRTRGLEALLAAADGALYEAKHAGRNRVHVAKVAALALAP